MAKPVPILCHVQALALLLWQAQIHQSATALVSVAFPVAGTLTVRQLLFEDILHAHLQPTKGNLLDSLNSPQRLVAINAAVEGLPCSLLPDGRYELGKASSSTMSSVAALYSQHLLATIRMSIPALLLLEALLTESSLLCLHILWEASYSDTTSLTGRCNAGQHSSHTLHQAHPPLLT